MIRAASLLTMIMASAATAETQAPDYYVDAVFAVSTAELLANFCPQVGFASDLATAEAEAVLARLAEDGITGDGVLRLIGVDTGVEALQGAFMAQYGLDEPSEDKICAAARAEMDTGSPIGAVLVENSQ